MCGIVGYTGDRNAPELLIHGLKCLEYRGYDSAGVAFFKGDADGAAIEIRKAEGKIANVEKLLKGEGSSGIQCGIGHTRWATHGSPTQRNAHPHRVGPVVLVHNGIIENHMSLRNQIIASGRQPQSETDSELFGFLVVEELEKGNPFVEAARLAFQKLEGACSVVLMVDHEPGTIVGIRNGSPLVVAREGARGVVFASDVQPILDLTRDVVFLENGDLAVGRLDRGFEIIDVRTGKSVSRASTHVDWSPGKVDKQGYPHYMLKEIHEQPVAMIDTLTGLISKVADGPFSFLQSKVVELLSRSSRVRVVACGTSFHAAMLAKYWFEELAGVPTEVELSSEFLYRDPVIEAGTLLIALSQSGETADTLSVVRRVKALGIATLGITNVRQSTLSRETDEVLYLGAGPEIGVAATKTFTSSNLALFMLAGQAAVIKRPQSLDRLKGLFSELIRLPALMEAGLSPDAPWIKESNRAADELYRKKGFFFIGRGYSYPLALEGALKLKEIAYLHAEGYAGGELKHGPIAMIDEEMVVVVLAPHDRWREKTLSNLQEVKARGAIILAIGDPSDRDLAAQSDYFVALPVPQSASFKFNPVLYPFLLTPALQILSYRIAVLRGTDVDQPRNLAKSVTVE